MTRDLRLFAVSVVAGALLCIGAMRLTYVLTHPAPSHCYERIGSRERVLATDLCLERHFGREFTKGE